MAVWRPELDVCLTDSEDEEENATGRDFKAGRETMLFVLDANLYANEERFKQALDIIRGAFITGLLVNDKDLLGIMFANTEHSPEPYEPNCLDNIAVPDNCAVFLPLRQLSKGIVEHFLRFLALAPETFGETYGIAANGGSFATMLRLCINLFDNCGYQCNNATIVFMTDRATPHSPQTHEYQMALQKANDLEGKSIEFHVIPMVDDFDYEQFYKEFITLARDVELGSFVAQDAAQLREILSDRKLKQDILKRTLGNFTFTLGEGVEISTRYYSYFKARSYPRKVKLLREDNSIVKQIRKIVVRKQDEESMEIIEEKEIKVTEGWYEIKLGAETIKFTPAQVQRVRNIRTPGMLLLGFKPKAALDDFIYYKKSNFMYPDNVRIAGSKLLFMTLWKRCLEREKIAVCLFMPKKNSLPRYVALVPVSAKSNEQNSVRALLSGDGFKIVYLPMAKHIRHNNLCDWNSIENEAPQAGVDIFGKIIRKLRIKYQPNLINDPVLEQLQANLLALSLNIRTEMDSNNGLPTAEQQDERIVEFMAEFDEVFGVDQAPSQVKKRTATNRLVDERPAKVAKIQDDDIKRLDYVKSMINNNTLSECTAVQLRTILKEHFDVKQPMNVNKSMLIERIKNLCT